MYPEASLAQVRDKFAFGDEVLKNSLSISGFKINFKESDEEIAEYIELLADGKIEVTPLTEWLKSNSTL